MSCSSRDWEPEVSVLMSCYNASRWLHEAIDSVLAQSLEDFEFILIDDGSTDETRSIIETYCERDGRIVSLNKQNTGLADSLNVGIAHAKGAWIARLDADDLCESTRLEDQLKFVRNHPGVVLLGTGFIEIDEHGRSIKEHLYPSGHRRLVRHLERLQQFFPHSSAMYRADVVRYVGAYNPRIRRSEDWRLWLELASQGQIACLPKTLVKIRKHTNQISLDDNGRRQFADGAAATVCHFLRKADSKDPSADASADEWKAFLSWVEKRIEESRAFLRRNAWGDARTELFASKNRLTGVLRFVTRLLQSGRHAELIWEKIFGSSLPRRLAHEWMQRSSEEHRDCSFKLPTHWR